MPAPALIPQLIQRFAESLPAYRASGYKEANLRLEFIDPFFEALGWDVYNKQGYAEAYKHVVVEDALKIGSAVKAPDYAFRIGGVRKFFVEAKATSVKIKDEISPAFQLRRYAWSAKLPLSILTDFEEFAVYDCRMRPDKNDKASTGHILFLTYQDYLEKWDEIAAIFSPQAILTGSFDKFAETSKAKHGTAEVDDAFLAEIERWRDSLAHNIALRNPQLSQRELNYAVQMTIDRIIFLRICEDRGIEFYGQMQALVNGNEVYPRLCQLFRKADERYNSGLFHFRAEKGQADTPDGLTLGLALDDKPLKEIIGSLYYPDSPYEFSVLPADILGQVYEQFLGKVIRLTGGHRAVVEEKPEVKKAGGVFYTPTYIVEYIVRHTLGALLEGKQPGDPGAGGKGAPLRVVDPACGSGSFLLGAYQYLLNWYRDGYIAAGPEKWAKGAHPRLAQTALPSPGIGRGAAASTLAGGEGEGWRLTTAERKRILLDHIYGVDIDPQAVEVTKLSLLLKVLEGESEQSLAHQLSFWQERALPDLGQNIQCGNSLIGPDFYGGAQMSFLEAEEQYRINAFDWQKAFPQVFRGGPDPKGFQNLSGLDAGGFDVVIGNPPYIRIQALKEWAPREVEFYKKRYTAASKGNYDIYVVFVEKGLSLLNSKGRLGFILPHKFFNAQYGQPLREILAGGKHLEKVVHFGDQQVFENATTYTCLMFLDKAGQDEFGFERVDNLQAWRDNAQSTTGIVAASSVTPTEWNFTVGKDAGLFEKLNQMPVKLGDIAKIFVGLQTSADTVFLFKLAELSSHPISVITSKELSRDFECESELLKPVVRSGEIGRYWAKPTALVLFPYEVSDGKFRLIPENSMRNRFPKAWHYLSANKKLLSEREHGKFNDTGWYQLYPKNLDFWEQPKIMLPYMITRLSAYFDEQGFYFVNVTTGGFGITIDKYDLSPKYVTGLFNSQLLDWYMRKVSTTFHGGYFAANKQFLVQLPIRPINFSDPTDAARHERMVALVERMLGLHQQLAAAKTPGDKTHLQRQIETTDRQIDALVYELYGLTEAEIAIVEGQ